MKSAPPEEGGCNAAFPLLCECLLSFSGRTLIFEHPLSFIPDFLQSIFYVTTSRKAAQKIHTIIQQTDERNTVYGLYHYIFGGNRIFYTPCMLPMLPVYISYFAGQSKDETGKRPKMIFKVIAFVVGFTVVFTALGLFRERLGSCFPDIKQS